MLTYEEVKQLFRYEPVTGKLIRTLRGGIQYYCSEVPNNSGYLVVRIKTKIYQTHRIIWLLQTGKFPEQEIDHINHIKHDNRWCNLREVSLHSNLKNKPLQLNNTSGITGVRWNKQIRKWHSYIMVNKKMYHLGYYILKLDAVINRKRAEIKHNFHPNHGK